MLRFPHDLIFVIDGEQTESEMYCKEGGEFRRYWQPSDRVCASSNTSEGQACGIQPSHSMQTHALVDNSREKKRRRRELRRQDGFVLRLTIMGLLQE